MKPLVCEMCGSTDLLKQDGVFVCQMCGVKYSVEEARKMMLDPGEEPVEIRGTVAIDNSKDAEKYLNLARTAAAGSNHEEALSYANKVLEIDDSNWEAYFIKGTAAAWTSKLGRNNFDDATVCWSTAIALAPEENALDVANDCLNEMGHVYTAMLALRLSTSKRALDNDQVSRCGTELLALKKQNLGNQLLLMVAAGNRGLADKIDTSHALGVIPLSQFVENVDTCAKHACESIKIWTGSQNLGSGARDAVGAVVMYETIIGLLDDKDQLNACNTLENAYNRMSSSLRQAQFNTGSMNTFYSSLRSLKQNIRTEQDKKAREEAEERRRKQEEQVKAYWEAHPDEKKAIEQEKDELLAKVKEIEAEYAERRKAIETEKNNLLQGEKVAEYEKELLSLGNELSRLGMFQGKEKRDLKQKISSVEEKKALVEAELRVAHDDIQKRVDSVEAEKKAKVRDYYNRIGELQNALAMGTPVKGSNNQEIKTSAGGNSNVKFVSAKINNREDADFSSSCTSKQELIDGILELGLLGCMDFEVVCDMSVDGMDMQLAITYSESCDLFIGISSDDSTYMYTQEKLDITLVEVVVKDIFSGDLRPSYLEWESVE